MGSGMLSYSAIFFIFLFKIMKWVLLYVCFLTNFRLLTYDIFYSKAIPDMLAIDIITYVFEIIFYLKGKEGNMNSVLKTRKQNYRNEFGYLSL